MQYWVTGWCVWSGVITCLLYRQKNNCAFVVNVVEHLLLLIKVNRHEDLRISDRLWDCRSLINNKQSYYFLRQMFMLLLLQQIITVYENNFILLFLVIFAYCMSVKLISSCFNLLYSSCKPSPTSLLSLFRRQKNAVYRVTEKPKSAKTPAWKVLALTLSVAKQRHLRPHPSMLNETWIGTGFWLFNIDAFPSPLLSVFVIVYSIQDLYKWAVTK